MFITANHVKQALETLAKVDPFYGITFLVCKKLQLPVGRTMELSLNKETRKFLEHYHKPFKTISSDQGTPYYRVTRTSDQNRHWLNFNYASSGLQSTNTQKFKDALTHPIKSKEWGWNNDYVEKLVDKLPGNNYKISVFYMAVWLYRDTDWPEDSTAQTLIGKFLEEFHITELEQEEIFNTEVPEVELDDLFQRFPLTDADNIYLFGPHPDAPPDEGGTLEYLEMVKVGPAQHLIFEPAQRLNLITGDNGLGKTFLIECAWWALTGKWASLPAYPSQNAKTGEAKISFCIAGKSTTGTTQKVTIPYEWENQDWKKLKNRPTIPGLIVYARVDGSFAVWDPLKQSRYESTDDFTFTRDDVWEGADRNFQGSKSSYINGLIRDLVQWQSRPDKYPFETFKNVLSRLSPPGQSDLGSLRLGEPVRLPRDSKEFPTLEHVYGTVPLPYVSAGVRRIITLAYLIVWAWEEHRINAKLDHREPESRMVILVDEIEAHLHPQWQRAILPALMDVGQDLSSALQIQFLVATHSPLVLTSAEPIFDDEVDGLFQLDLTSNNLFGNDVSLNQHPFIYQGTASGWLQSDVIGLEEERSLIAENLIRRARNLQRKEHPEPDEIRKISQELLQVLRAENDKFWPRWVFFAEQHGVVL